MEEQNIPNHLQMKQSWTNSYLASHVRLLETIQRKGCTLSGIDYTQSPGSEFKPFQEHLQCFKGLLQTECTLVNCAR